MKETGLTGLEVAVIGYAARINDCLSAEAYWEKLVKSEETFQHYSTAELTALGVRPEIYEHPEYVPVAGRLSEREAFDAQFFGYTPAEVNMMDPQIRIFHEMVYNALEMAGYAPGKTAQQIGLYASAGDSAIWQALVSLAGGTGGMESGFLSNKDYLCSLINYKLNLRGPALFMQTACSSSLVAVHQAVRALLTGDCGIAVAGGVAVSLLDTGGYMYEENSIYSRDGHCRAFDEAGNGTLKGEGGGAVVLKKYQDALRDRDTIYAVIKGSAVNNDGSEKVGFTAPGVRGQQEVVKKSLRIAGVEARDISYVEMHGTGTRLGDPVEFQALSDAFGRQPQKIPVGSVKTNIGHLDAAAGIASLIKVILMLQHRVIPASLHFSRPNPNIAFEESPFYVNTVCSPWKPVNGKLRAGISSLGIGGTNCHLVVEEPEKQPPAEVAPGEHYVHLSARSPEILRSMTSNLVKYLAEHPAARLVDLAYTTHCGRADFNCRMAVGADSIASLAGKLSALKWPAAYSHPARKIVFAFTGQGSQYMEMAKDLYRELPSFKHSMDECFVLIADYYGLSVKEILFPATGEVDDRIHDTLYAQLTIFAISYAMARLLIEMGVQPAAVIGHSIGEYVAAVIAGMWDLQTAIRVVGMRGTLMQQTAPGKMFAVFESLENLESWLPEGISVAAVNGPQLVVLAGGLPAMEALAATLEDKQISYKPLQTAYAFHSVLMDPVLEEYHTFLQDFPCKKNQLPLISNVSGKWLEEAPDARYWATHLRQTVNFAAGIQVLLDNGYDTFVEIGPGQQLTKIIRGLLADKQVLLCNTLRNASEPVNDRSYLSKHLSALWQAGLHIKWELLYEATTARRIALPVYPFEKTLFPLSTALQQVIARISGQALPIPDTDTRKAESNWLYQEVWRAEKLPPALYPPAGSTVLVFCDRTGHAAHIAGQLTAANINTILVDQGTSFHQYHDGYYLLDPSDMNGYQQLMAAVTAGGHRIGAILHAYQLDDAGQVVDAALHAGYLSLAYLVKALVAAGIEEPIELSVLSTATIQTTETEKLDPLKAMALGALKIIATEHSNLRCRFLDVKPEELFNNATAILQALFAASTPILAAFRGTEWLLPEMNAIHSPADTVVLQSDGCYLVTGAFGGMGFAAASDLAKRHPVKLALLGRSTFPQEQYWEQWLASHAPDDITSQQILRLREMKAAGTEVLLLQADVASFDDMRDAIARTTAAFGRINGIIFAAGVIDYDGVIRRREKEQLIRNIRCKVHAILLLQQLIDFSQLDFVTLFSSNGNLYYEEKFGQVAYNVANEFLNAYALSNAATANITTINWCDWKQTGMSVKALQRRDTSMTSGEVAHYLSNGLSTEEGVEVLWQAIAAPGASITVSKAMIKGRHLPVENRPVPLATVLFNRPEMATAYRAPASAIEKELAKICCQLFGMAKVGIDDDFLEIGGDSLKAIHYINSVRKTLGIKLSLEDFFAHATIARLATLVESRTTPAIAGSVALQPLIPLQDFALLPSQNRLFIQQGLFPDQTFYNQVFLFKTDAIPVEKLTVALRELLKSHEVLRSSFSQTNGKLVQRFHTNVSPDLTFYTLQDNFPLPAALAAFERPFNLEKPPLFRVAVIKGGNTVPHDYLAIDLHHIISDGTSNQRFLADLSTLLNDGKLPTPTTGFRDYLDWFYSPATQAELETEAGYWQQRFQDYSIPAGMPTDFKRGPQQSREGAKFRFAISAPLTRQLHEVARQQGVTLFTLQLAALYVLIHKLTGDTDFVIGGTHLGRDIGGFESVMGMFIETLAFRNQVHGKDTFSSLLELVKSNTYRDFDNRRYPFELLVEWLRLPKNMSRNPLFDIAFSSDDLDSTATGNAPDNKYNIEFSTHQQLQVSFDLLFTYSQANDALQYCITYNKGLYKEATIRACSDFYTQILEQLAAAPGMLIEHITLRNNTSIPLPVPAKGRQGHILAQITQLAAQQGSEMAITDEGNITSYQELITSADRMARYLLEHCNIQPGNRVGILLERSAHTIIAMLAVMRVNAVFVPIDISLPEQRIYYMLETAQCKALVTVADNMFEYTGLDIPVFAIDIQLETLSAPMDQPFAGNAGDPAYILFTSGSTGYPKGVLINHGSLYNYINWANHYYFGDAPALKMPFFSAVSFDFTLTSIFSPLTRGAHVAIYRDSTNIYDTLNAIFTAGTGAVKVTPAHIDLLASMDISATGISVAIVGGEAFLPHQVAHLKRLNPHMQLYNEYGPTEATVGCVAGPVENNQPVTIGTPIDGTQIFVVNEALELLPPLAPGELMICGDGLASGYLDAAQTAEKFIQLQTPDGPVRAYHSGDKGYYNSDGVLVFLGRLHAGGQVKIRGYRIELKEIEAVLLRYAGIQRALVVVRKVKEEELIVAYYLSQTPLEDKAIKTYLRQHLPEQMMPAVIMWLDVLPLNHNGKVDLQALPKPLEAAAPVENIPHGSLEWRLTQIWARVLHTAASEFGIHDSFFNVGGNSLRVLQLAQYIEQEFNVPVAVAAIFDMDTIHTFIQGYLEQQLREMPVVTAS
ncbi:amino acid adenylation domain-containing protein [Chitinophaga costaii]|uniref:Amino acid adenylation domain-containing protein n=1 Tax=Chitinophaga costaii TaxID=1335309 RepID=A0A1C3YTL5_9BACT|nr:hybrid non-ribosomal peptide synthetase/type I polyketide synthase [Chitinophaga costaii]PUZ30102.1 amino acid adenylation domain-containing protein [Chitinophaga costaii]SCB73446.1 amino acid adenylation domain-containing protein [Chitinophaga costaii]